MKNICFLIILFTNLLFSQVDTAKVQALDKQLKKLEEQHKAILQILETKQAYKIILEKEISDLQKGESLITGYWQAKKEEFDSLKTKKKRE